ncbi:MAG: SDR family NAD(P)-dependent oxidoreductase, partial [Anaerolineales bacterium]
LELHHWKRVMDVNLMGVIHGTTVAYAQMIRQGNGHIVNIASLAGLVPFPSSVPYTMSKHAVVGLSTALRAEGADFGVKVSVVCPAFIKTGMMDANTLVGVRREDVKARQNRWLPTADRAAEAILRGVARNREFIVFPFYARLLWWVGRLWPAGPLPLRRKMVNDFRVLRGKFNENYP